MKMLIAGQRVDAAEQIEVLNPYDGSVVDTVPAAQPEHVEAAIAAAVEGARQMRALPGYERFRILRKASELLFQRRQELGWLISQEEGKTLREGVAEAARAAEVLELSAEEAKRISGEVLPLDGASNGRHRLGFTLRVPCGVVVAITPFNFPLNLPCHKVGPALAAGNAVILKPASDTPLSSLKLTEILLEAGVPPAAISCLTGGGARLGAALCRDPRVRKISFTGSREVGEQIARAAGIKRVTLELGSNCPLIIMDDANLEKAAEAIMATGYSNAGQVCISTQRVLAVQRVYDELIDRLGPLVAAHRAGDPLDESTKMGPMVRAADARRVGQWIDEAVASGARLVASGRREGTLMDAALLADVAPEMKISCQELFGPAVAVTPAADLETAIRLANDTPYGLSAAIFTESLDRAIRFARGVDSGNLHINWGPQWRADLMPYGGLKDSGLGKEGPRYAVEEMTEVKTVVIHGVD
jgi:acyl-CoA reductase-like NAD-dependent aldehyde dehydrogenase